MIKVNLKMLVALCVILLETFMLKDDVDFMISILEEEISDSSMYSALALACWNHPDLVLDMLSVQEC